jgi:tetratricopeptide (TPR) repeat protein
MTFSFSRPVLLSLTLLASASLCACAANSPEGLRASTGSQPVGAALAQDREASSFGLYLAGEAAIDGGASREAAAYFERASQLEPDSPTLRDRAFSSALISGEIGKAAAAAQNLGDGDDPIQTLGRLTRGVEAMAQNDGRGAVAVLSANPPVLGPHNVAVALLKPWAQAMAGDWVAATAPRPLLAQDPVASGVADLGRAELLERSGKLSDAEAVYKARASGKSGLYSLAYGGFLERQNRRDEAIALYSKVLVATPGDAAIRVARSRAQAKLAPRPLPTLMQGGAEALIAPAAVLLARREGDSGLAYLRLALRLDPTLDEAWVLVGDAMSAAGDNEAARDAYLKVKPGSEQYVSARGRLSLQLQAANDKDGALRAARETLDAAPTDPRALVLYADLLRDDERYAEAVQVLTRAIAAETADTGGEVWSLYYLRGAAEERAGDWTKAEADLQHALLLKPDEPQVLNYLGYAWADRGEHLKDALAMLEKAAALEPKSGAIVDSLGWAHYRIHQYADAAKELEQAVLLDPSDPEVNNHLGDAYWRTGRTLEARYQWNRVLTLDADAKTKAAVQTKLLAGLPPEGPAPTVQP